MKAFTLLLIGVWIGLVLGLSFIEAPLKFQAPGITTPLGLGIGRLVFGFSNKIQMLLMFVLLSFMFLNLKNQSKRAWIFSFVLLLILGIQGLYLLPVLDARAVQIINDISLPPTNDHFYFVGLEVLKITTLTLLYLNTYKQWKT